MNEYFCWGLGNASSAGYISMNTLENLLQAWDPHCSYLPRNEGQVDDAKRTLPFLYRNIQDWVTYLLGQSAYRYDII